MKEKNHVLISISANYWQYSITIDDKNSQQIRNIGELNLKKVCLLKKTTATTVTDIILNGERLNALFLRLGRR